MKCETIGCHKRVTRVRLKRQDQYGKKFYEHGCEDHIKTEWEEQNEHL